MTPARPTAEIPAAEPGTLGEAPAEALTPGGPRTTSARRLARTVKACAPHVGVLGLLLGLSLFLWWHVWGSGSPSSTLLCPCGDPGQTVWFLAWVPWALAHGHNPLFSAEIFAGQGGANLLESTSYLFPSFVLSPVTWLFGPTVSFNVIQTLAPVASGWCLFVAARRVTSSWAGPAAAALLWGFSPFMLSSLEYGHLNFALMIFLPLAFVVVFELVASDRRRPVTLGLALGLIVVTQFFSGTEPLAIEGLMSVVALIVAALVAPRAAWRRRRRIAIGFAVAVVAAGVLLAYPLWFLLAGPRHIIGPPWPGLQIFGAHSSDIVRSGTAVHSSSYFAQAGGYYGASGPPGAYLGPAVLILLAFSALVWWRNRLAWVLAVTGAVAWLCSLGALLMPLGAHSSQWWLPWNYVQHLPLLENIGPNRFALVVAFAAAMLLALSLDGWQALARSALERFPPAAKLTRRALATSAAAVLAAIVAVAALPIIQSYTWPFTTHAIATPPWFETGARHLSPATEVLTYPYASSFESDAMYWQAEDDFSFRLVSGRAEIPGADGRHSEHIDPLTGTDALLADASFGFGPLAAPSRATLASIRSSLRQWGVDVLVIVRAGRAPGFAAAMFTAVLGRLPHSIGGTYVWFGVKGPGPPPLDIAPAAIERCAGGGLDPTSFARAPTCTIQSAVAAKAAAGRRNRLGTRQ